MDFGSVSNYLRYLVTGFPSRDSFLRQKRTRYYLGTRLLQAWRRATHISYSPLRLKQGGVNVLDMFALSAYPAPVLRWRQGPVMSGFLTFMDRYRDEAACITALAE